MVPDLLMADLAHDDRAVAAIARVKQLLQRTVPERLDSGEGERERERARESERERERARESERNCDA